MIRTVFISHASQDFNAADRIRALLEDRGINCWIAPRDIPAGSSYGEEIIKAIDQCAVTLLVFTDKANQSRAVANELELSFARERVILPVRLEKIEPSSNIEFWLSRTQWVDAFEVPLRRRIQDILPIIAAASQGQPSPPVPPQKATILGRIEKALEIGFRYPKLAVTSGIAILTIVLVGLWTAVGTQEKIARNNADMIAFDPSTFGLVTLVDSPPPTSKFRDLTATIYLNLKGVKAGEMQFLATPVSTTNPLPTINLSTAIDPSLSEDAAFVDFSVPSNARSVAVCMIARHPTLEKHFTARWIFDLSSPTQISPSEPPRLFEGKSSSC
jgi:hypothetical protein